MKNFTIIFLIAVIGCITTKAQRVTYDTTFSGWNARVTYDPSKTDSSECIIFFPGAGEVGTDVTKLRIYGPHYWLLNGWDGGVQLGNGVHYPIYISLQPPNQSSQPPLVKARIDLILSRYKIKRNALHFTGPSAGGWYSSTFVSYIPTPGDNSYGLMVKSVCVPESVKPASIYGATEAYPLNMVDYAKLGGKLLGFDQINDGGRDMQTYCQAMNDNVPNSATRIVTNFGAGTHCCFENFWNPAQNNWTASNPSVVSLGTGQYWTENVYQWMLRNGDTSMPTSAQPLVAKAGNDQTLTLPINSTSLNGSASTGNIKNYFWTELSGGTVAITSPSSMNTTIIGLVAGLYSFQLAVSDGTNTSMDTVIIIVNAAANQSPVANAGSSQTITLPVNSAILNGSASSDPDGSIVSYSWAQLSGPSTATITNANSVSPTVSNLQAGSYTFQLTVTDNNGANGQAQVKIIVNAAANQSPVANAGINQAITLPVNSVALDGSASFDPDGSIVSYSWIKTAGPGAVTITNSNTVNPTVIGLQAGSYTFQLTVTDNKGASASDQVSVTVNAAPITPPVQPTQPIVANAGVDTTISLPATTALLNGSASSGPSTLNFRWTLDSGPAGAIIAAPNAAISSISGLVAGNYIFKLTVSDDNGNSASATVKISVIDNLRSSESFVIYPNPAHDIVNFRIISDLMGKIDITIIDVNGKIMSVIEADKQEAYLDKSINISQLSKGIYFVQVSIENSTKQNMNKLLIAKFIKL